MSRGSEPAYPVKDTFNTDRHGMTLREHFAGLAMQGLLANPHYAQQMEDGDRFQGSVESAARYHADALLAELSKVQP